MTMKIEVTIPEDEIKNGNSATYLEKAMWALGYGRTAMATRENETYAEANVNEVLPDEGPNYAAMKAAHDATEAPKRERGKPAMGRARRTKEEIAEDEAADKADAFAPAAEPVAAISTGEERIDPTTAEDEAQDAEDEAAEDEAAEAEATKPATLTHDDVRSVMRRYQAKYGELAIMQDGPKVIELMFGGSVQPQNPEKGWKVSDIPSDQASLAKAAAGFEEMLAKNPFSRSVDL